MRSKEYDLAPDNDLDISEAGVRFNYHAGYAWNWYAGFEQADYDYATLTRRFTRTTADAGAGYRCGPLRTAVDYRHRENSYDTNAAFDYTRDDLDFSLAYRLDRNRWRLYYGVSLLDQTALNSYNDYTETRLGAGWDVDLDADTRLKLSYDYSERDYDVFSDNDYSRLGATIEFDL